MFAKFKNIINLICKYIKNTKILIGNKTGLYEHSFNGGGDITKIIICVNDKPLFHITTNNNILILEFDKSYKLYYTIKYKRERNNNIIITKNTDNDIIINNFKKISFNPQINWQIYYMLILLNNSSLGIIKKYVYQMIDFYCDKYNEYDNIMNCLILFTCENHFQGDCILNTYCLMDNNMMWYKNISNNLNEIVNFKKYEFNYLIEKNNPNSKNIINDTNILIFKDTIKNIVDNKYLSLSYKLYGDGFDDYHVVIGKRDNGLYICDTNNSLIFFDASDISNYNDYLNKYLAIDILHNGETILSIDKYAGILINDSEEELDGGLIIKWNYVIIMFLIIIVIIIIITVKNTKNNKNNI